MALLKKSAELQKAEYKLQDAVNEANIKITELGSSAEELFQSLNEIQDLFDTIRGVPSEKIPEYEELRKRRNNWKNQAEIIAEQYDTAIKTSVKGAAVGAGAGVAIATMGPQAAMGVVTAFGVASTGVQISTLTGAAATNAALALLGGGTLAAGGGGVAAGEALLAFAGPIGWSIAGISMLATGIMFLKKRGDNKRLERISIDICNRDIVVYKTTLVELAERIARVKDETDKIGIAIDVINTYSFEYDQLDEQQKNTLWAAYDLMASSTQLLIEPIKGLQPHYTEDDFAVYVRCFDDFWRNYYESQKEITIYLANQLYRIELDDKDVKLLAKSFRMNKKMLKEFNVDKRRITDVLIARVLSMLSFKLNQENLLQQTNS